MKYELVNNSNKVGQFFRIDSETGVVSLRDSLRKDLEREYKVSTTTQSSLCCDLKFYYFQLRIRAYDLGKPALSTMATVVVLVDHVAPPMQQEVTHMSFSEMTYSVSVAEDALIHTLIKNLSVVSRPNELLPVSCEIISGNAEGINYNSIVLCNACNIEKVLTYCLSFCPDMFYIKDATERNCELRLKRNLDFEISQRYEIEVQLKTTHNLISQDRGTVRVTRIRLNLLLYFE